MTAELVAFWITAVIAAGSGLMVVLHRSPVRSALFLVLNFLCLAFLYLLRNAPLLAALQVLVYAGAIMVLFLFVIMLLNLGGEQRLEDPLPGQRGWAVILGLSLIVGLGLAVISASRLLPQEAARTSTTVEAQAQQVRDIGRAMMTDYVYPFELTSALLLVGIIGTVLLAKKRLPGEGEGHGRS
jgi:NADH-quinone oxidoreductase subunit J